MNSAMLRPRLCDLFEDLHEPREVGSAVGVAEFGGEGAPADELHRQEGVAVGKRTEFVDGRIPGVRESGRDLRFLNEPLGGVAGPVAEEQHLDGDVAAELRLRAARTIPIPPRAISWATSYPGTRGTRGNAPAARPCRSRHNLDQTSRQQRRSRWKRFPRRPRASRAWFGRRCLGTVWGCFRTDAPTLTVSSAGMGVPTAGCDRFPWRPGRGIPEGRSKGSLVWCGLSGVYFTIRWLSLTCSSPRRTLLEISRGGARDHTSR